MFYDASGFELCRGDPSGLTRMVDSAGKVSSLYGNGFLLGCSTNEYVEASNWNVTYRFPNLNTWNHSATATPIEGLLAGKDTKSISRRHASTNVKGEDSITGVASWLGQVETKEGHTFHISREGEQMTILGWSAAQRIRYECKNGSCSLENLDNSETVHASMVR